jgi:glutamine synthetase
MYDPAIPPEIKPQGRQPVSDDDPGRVMAVMEQSELVAEALGEHVFDFFLRNKREEWSDYRRQVTRLELDRYLPML